MKLAHERKDTVTVVTITGDLVSEGVDQLKRYVGKLFEDKAHDLVIDMADCDFADSKGLESLLWMQTRCKDALGQLRLIHVSEGLGQILTITRLTQRIAVCEDLNEAVTSLASGADPASAAPAASDKPVMTTRLGDYLTQQGLITDAQLEEALARQSRSGVKKLLGQVLVEMELLTEEQLTAVMAEVCNVPFARLSAKLADPAVIESLPREFVEKNGVLPLFLVDERLTVAIHKIMDVFLIEEIERQAGMPVQLVAATKADIQSTLDSYMPEANVFVIDEIFDDIRDTDLTVVEKQEFDLAAAEDAAGESPVIKLVNTIIHAAVQEGASDIHIEPDDSSFRVRFRIDGKLAERLKPPPRMQPAIVSRIKIMAGMDISERRIPQDGGITVVAGQRPIDLRVSTNPGKFGEKVVIRVIDNRGRLGSLDSLGFSHAMLESFRSAVQEPNGVVLVTGPTEIVDETLNVSTVEDPVEYNLPGVNQFQTNEKAGYTFAGALRTLLRQDPDVIMVGEIRDQETARIAIQAALTGHLVLSTLHTNDAPSAVTRLINIGVEPYLVAACVRGVLAQRLVRRICAHCKEQAPVPERLKRVLGGVFNGELDLSNVYIGEGCPRCRGTGYAGRVGLYEYLSPNDEMLDAISRGASLQELRRMALKGDYTPLYVDGLAKVKAGLTTVEEMLAVLPRAALQAHNEAA